MQVKELGVYFRSCSKVVHLLERYFNNFWTLTDLNATELTTVVWDQQWQLRRRVRVSCTLWTPRSVACEFSPSLALFLT